MAIRIIRQEGDEILKKKSRPVEVIDEKLQELIEDMIETMHQKDGVGLAAVQVGILKRVIIVDTYEEGDPLHVFINPEIIEEKGKREVDEGCLSFPNKFAKVIRPEKVKIKALNREGKEIKITATGLLAQAICHEIDHLEGVVLIDRMIPGTLETVTPDKNNNGGN